MRGKIRLFTYKTANSEIHTGNKGNTTPGTPFPHCLNTFGQFSAAGKFFFFKGNTEAVFKEIARAQERNDVKR